MKYVVFSDIHGNMPALIAMLEHFYAVLGNHDDYYLNMLNDTSKRIIYAEKYGKSYLKNMSYEEREYLSKLPVLRELNLAGKQIIIAHGSLEMPLEGRVYPDTIVDEHLYQQYDIVILGHTHYQMHRKVGKTLLLNPGSLGQPRDYKGYSFCVIDLVDENCTFLNVNIEQTVLIDELIAQGEKKELIDYIQSKMRKLI